MTATVSQLAILFAFIFLGFTVGRIKHVTIEKSNVLSVLLVNIFLPCKVFLNFSDRCTLPYLKSNYPTILVSVAFLLLLVLFSWAIAKVLTKDRYERKVYRYSFAISNYAYLGYVFVEATFGEQALTDMIFFCIPFAFYTYTFGYALLTDSVGSVKKLFNPMVIALALGMVFGIFGIKMPSVPATILDYASDCVGPLSMILTGLVIASFSPKDLIPDTRSAIFTALRLVIIPALLLSLCLILKAIGLLPNTVFPAAVIMGCMPCGLNTIVFPLFAGKDCKMGVRFVLLSHALSLISIPLWMLILA